MKLQLIILILLFSIKGMTQVRHNALKYYHKKFPSSGKDNLPQNLSLYNQSENKNQTVYFALQDNMPCIVPLRGSVPYMPNLWTGKGAHEFSDKMPNPADVLRK